MAKLAAPFALAVSVVLGACASESVTPEDPCSGGKCDDAEDAGKVGGSHDALSTAIVGEFVGLLNEQAPVFARVQESQASNSRFRQFDVALETPSISTSAGELNVPLTYDAERDMFIGFAREHCDDPGCTAVDSLFVKVWQVESGEVRMRYTLSAVRFGDEEPEIDTPIFETARLVQQQPDAPASDLIVFAADSQIPADVQALMTEVVIEDCAPDAAYTVVEENITNADGEILFEAIMEGGQGGAFLTVARTESGELEIAEISCE